MIAGGGTGGHVFPALALADQLRRDCPGCEILLVGSRGGLEERLVPAHGYRLELLRVGKLRGAGLAASLRTLATLPGVGLTALRLLREFRPDVVVGVGGYASGPIVLAAALLRLPRIVLEQNSIPGTTNRILARFADRVVIAFRHSARYLPGERTLLLGNPLRPALVEELERPAQRDPAHPCLLVLGGSQGAHALNELVTAAAPALARRVPGLEIIHQTGATDLPPVRERYAALGLPARVEPFIEEMASVYRRADLALSRAGATTLAELCVAGVPALLVPYPFAADDHQAENAREIAEGGGALALAQQGLTAERLAEVAGELLGDRTRLTAMGQAMRAAAFPDAAGAVVDQLLELTRRQAA